MQDNKEQEEYYKSQLDALHKIQYDSLLEEDKHTEKYTVNELLEKLASGQNLSNHESNYIKIYSNLSDYEKAISKGKIKNDLYPQISRMFKNYGIDLEGESFELIIDNSGKVSINCDIDEDILSLIEDEIERECGTSLRDYYMQAADIPVDIYRYIKGYEDVNQFIKKATNGEKSYKDIVVAENGKIGGIPQTISDLLNAPQGNGKYEFLQEMIYSLNSYENKNGKEFGFISNFQAKYEIKENDINIVNTLEVNENKFGYSYYKSMKPIRGFY